MIAVDDWQTPRSAAWVWWAGLAFAVWGAVAGFWQIPILLAIGTFADFLWNAPNCRWRPLKEMKPSAEMQTALDALSAHLDLKNKWQLTHSGTAKSSLHCRFERAAVELGEHSPGSILMISVPVRSSEIGSRGRPVGIAVRSHCDGTPLISANSSPAALREGVRYHYRYGASLTELLAEHQSRVFDVEPVTVKSIHKESKQALSVQDRRRMLPHILKLRFLRRATIQT